MRSGKNRWGKQSDQIFFSLSPQKKHTRFPDKERNKHFIVSLLFLLPKQKFQLKKKKKNSKILPPEKRKEKWIISEKRKNEIILRERTARWSRLSWLNPVRREHTQSDGEEEEEEEEENVW
jgi:hypothetical protein